MEQIPAGRYFIGDPCYAIAEEQWHDYLEPLWSGRGVFSYNDVKCFATGTAYGDGVFTDQNGNEYPVDAGLIGATPEALWGADRVADLEELGRIVVFENPVSVDEKDGVIYIGGIAIDTN